ncbi:ribonuclease H-like domain-containing protein [Tanacetum coccineum]
MAGLPPRAQRHLWLRYGIEGYDEGIVQDYELRLATLFSRQVNQSDTELGLDIVDTLCFQLGAARRSMTWRQFILDLGLHTAEEMAVDGFKAYWVGSLREITDKDDVDINTLTIEQYLAWVQDDNDFKFEINSNFMRELRRKLFKGTDDKDVHEHVRRVLEISDLFHFPGVTYDAVMLRVFPITLKGPALRWINRLSAGLVTTWDLLEKASIKQYCPPFKTVKKLGIICNFKQEMNETLYHAWERYNDLLFKYPQQDLNCQQKVHIFYTGLNIPTRKVLDS